MNKKIVKISDKMQKGYKYELVEPVGKNFHPDFRPDLTPKQILSLGAFGGVYMRDCLKEFPKDWFTKAKFAPNGTFEHLTEINYFKVNASQPLSVWRKKGWINEEHDPRGWFQWYCRYYMGRRLGKEDIRQIRRWNAMRRHIGQIKANCRAGDTSCRPRQRQALLHWAYDTRLI
jgi:hypothetical protein